MTLGKDLNGALTAVSQAHKALTEKWKALEESEDEALKDFIYEQIKTPQTAHDCIRHAQGTARDKP